MSQLLTNLTRSQLIQASLDERNAFPTAQGNLFTWGDQESTGRSPKNTFIVRHESIEKNIDWTSPTNLPMKPERFDELWEYAEQKLSSCEKVYVHERVIGADSSYSLPVKLKTNSPLSALFADNMFLPVPHEIKQSHLYEKSFELITLPYDKAFPLLSEEGAGGVASTSLIVAMDFKKNRGLVIGSSYLGAVKKLMFTALNYYAPEIGVLPLHCAANEGTDGTSALILGLSGTGKTTLSADLSRPLLGDDEHGWSDNGIANFENGCYAKLIDLNPEKEPEIFRIAFGDSGKISERGVIIENTMIYPNGNFDLSDRRLTENSRVSYPLSFLSNAKPSGKSGHPRTIIFLTADANGVLPPVAKLSTKQAMLWFLLGYTSKLAGTETGIKEPVSTFSRFFGGPFMPRNPQDYLSLLNKKIEQHGVQVYLLNTGWTGGPYGVGKRFDITLTRKLLDACLNGTLERVPYREDTRFHFQVPMQCEGIDPAMFSPHVLWKSQEEYELRANKLAQEFSQAFDKNFSLLGAELAQVCPGKA